jgi:hypothetical protein
MELNFGQWEVSKTVIWFFSDLPEKTVGEHFFLCVGNMSVRAVVVTLCREDDLGPD